MKRNKSIGLIVTGTSLVVIVIILYIIIFKNNEKDKFYEILNSNDYEYKTEYLKDYLTKEQIEKIYDEKMYGNFSIEDLCDITKNQYLISLLENNRINDFKKNFKELINQYFSNEYFSNLIVNICNEYKDNIDIIINELDNAYKKENDILQKISWNSSLLFIYESIEDYDNIDRLEKEREIMINSIKQ